MGVVNISNTPVIFNICILDDCFLFYLIYSSIFIQWIYYTDLLFKYSFVLGFSFCVVTERGNQE